MLGEWNTKRREPNADTTEFSSYPRWRSHGYATKCTSGTDSSVPVFLVQQRSNLDTVNAQRQQDSCSKNAPKLAAMSTLTFSTSSLASTCPTRTTSPSWTAASRRCASEGPSATRATGNVSCLATDESGCKSALHRYVVELKPHELTSQRVYEPKYTGIHPELRSSCRLLAAGRTARVLRRVAVLDYRTLPNSNQLLILISCT